MDGLDRAIGINTMERAMTRSSRSMTVFRTKRFGWTVSVSCQDGTSVTVARAFRRPAPPMFTKHRVSGP